MLSTLPEFSNLFIASYAIAHCVSAGKNSVKQVLKLFNSNHPELSSCCIIQLFSTRCQALHSQLHCIHIYCLKEQLLYFFEVRPQFWQILHFLNCHIVYHMYNCEPRNKSKYLQKHDNFLIHH